MKTFINSQILKYLLFAWFCLLLGFAGISFVIAKTITVSVMVDKKIRSNMDVYAIGFSVNKKGKGNLGWYTKRSGPSHNRYSFGFKSLSGNVSCGSSVLKRNSIVVLYFKDNKCRHRVYHKRNR